MLTSDELYELKRIGHMVVISEKPYHQWQTESLISSYQLEASSWLELSTNVA
jgi:hypothetical protein